MADFKHSLEKTLTQEGFYSRGKRNEKEEVYCGISRRVFPDWEGWDLVDKYKSEFGLPQWTTVISEAEHCVEDFYRKSFWNPIKGDEIKHQALADVVFDTAVTLGLRFAVILMQEVLHDNFGAMDLTLDGKVGQKALEALNNTPDGERVVFGVKVPGVYLFLVQYSALRMRRFASLARSGESQQISDWARRTFLFLGGK